MTVQKKDFWGDTFGSTGNVGIKSNNRKNRLDAIMCTQHHKTEFKTEGDGTFPGVRRHFVSLFISICYLLHAFYIIQHVRIHIFFNSFSPVYHAYWVCLMWSNVIKLSQCLLKLMHFHNTSSQAVHFSILARTIRSNYPTEQSESCETQL